MLRLGGIVFLMLLTACGTYRTGSSGYRSGNGEYNGVGQFKTPSDYSTGTDDNMPEDQIQDARSVHGNRQNYIPNGPFKLFWPVANIHVNRGFQSSPKHQGLDLGGARGMPILAAHDGVVIYAGHGFHGYGNMVLIEFSAEWATLYGHLDGFAVREGQTVRAGDPIGAMGATGHTTGVHLHFELMHNRSPIDPLTMLTNGKQLAEQLRARKRRPAAYR